jgi:hypothetical protein
MGTSLQFRVTSYKSLKVNFLSSNSHLAGTEV